MTDAASSPPPLVLASSSPRRAHYLRMLGLEFTVDPARIPEELVDGEGAAKHVERLARDKAVEVRARRPGALVLAGDTVVAVQGEILGKPATEDEAVSMLLLLQGRTHVVHSGLALASPEGGMESGVSTTAVTFRGFDEEEARAYVATGEPMDKAGSYGIQGMGAAVVERVEGDYFTVAGLPVPLLVRLLARVGWPYSFGGLRAGERAAP